MGQRRIILHLRCAARRQYGDVAVNKTKKNSGILATKAPVLIRRDPVVDRKKRWPMCRLTMYSADRSQSDCVEELSAVVGTLGKINRTFLVQFAGVLSLDGLEKMILPDNVAMIENQSEADTSVLYKGERYAVGWNILDSSPVPTNLRLPPTEATVIRILGLLTRNADVDDVANAMKADPALQYNLLKYLNHANLCLAAFGGFRSFDHAIMLLGYRQFSRWLSMFLLQSNVEAAVPELYRIAITRGCQMELLAERSGIPRNERDSVFITGVFSLIDRILGVSMQTVLEALALGPSVNDALLSGEGRYAPLLQFAQACENGTECEMYEQLEQLGISARDANLAMVEGMQYAAEFDEAD